MTQGERKMRLAGAPTVSTPCADELEISMRAKHKTAKRLSDELTMGNCIQTTASTQDSNKNTDDSLSFRYQTGTCALEYWEPIKLIGEGSISTIHLVKRRPHRVPIPYKERADVMREDVLKASSKIQDSSSTSQQEQQEVYALKSIMKDHVRTDRYLEEMRREIYTMSRLHHPNIVRVIEAYERKRHIYLIMEYCRGGDLYQVQGTSETMVQSIVRHILSAVAYMHKHKVVHRDRKYQIVETR